MHRLILPNTPYPLLDYHILKNKGTCSFIEENSIEQTIEYTSVQGEDILLIKIDECTYISIEGKNSLINEIYNQLNKITKIVYKDDSHKICLYAEDELIDYWWGNVVYITDIELAELLLLNL